MHREVTREVAVIKVLLADDHAFVRGAVAELLAATDDITVVAECADGSEVLEAAVRTDPQVVLMDLAMPDRTGLEATRDLLDAGVSQPRRPAHRVLLRGVGPGGPRPRRSGLPAQGRRPDGAARLVRAVASGGSAWSPRASASLPDRD